MKQKQQIQQQNNADKALELLASLPEEEQDKIIEYIQTLVELQNEQG